MTSDWEAARRERLAPLEPLVRRVEEILFRHDPIGIADEEVGNLDEYRSEAEAVVLRLDGVASEAELAHLLHSEFVRFFDARIAGPLSRYAPPAAEVWALVRDRRAPGNGADPTA